MQDLPGIFGQVTSKKTGAKFAPVFIINKNSPQLNCSRFTGRIWKKSEEDQIMETYKFTEESFLTVSEIHSFYIISHAWE